MVVFKGALIKSLGLTGGLAAAAAGACFAAGQDADTVELRFRVFRSGEGDWNGIRVAMSDEASKPVIFRKNRRSAPIDYCGAHPLIFFRELLEPSTAATPIPSGAAPSQSLARVSLSPGLREALVFFVAVPDEDRFFAYTVDDSLDAFPAGSLRVVNFSGIDLIGKVGRQKKAHFPQGASAAYRHLSSGNEEISVVFVRDAPSGPQVVFHKRLQYVAHQRVILLFEPPRHPGSSRFVVKRITQSVRSAPVLESVRGS